MSIEFAALNPEGRHVGEEKPINAGIQDLAGKTIIEVWNEYFWGDVMFPALRQKLKRDFKDIKIIPYTETPSIAPPENMDQQCTILKRLMSKTGASAVIAGVGG